VRERQDPGAAPAPEFSRPLAADKVGRNGYALAIEAAEAERAGLARRFGLLALDRLVAQCRLRPVAGGMIELACSFEAAVTQECVVTLEPVPATVREAFVQRYALDPAAIRGLIGDDEPFDLEAEDPPEALADGAIDLGEAVAQQLAIALDPYPRAPGVSIEALQEVVKDRAVELRTDLSPDETSAAAGKDSPGKINPFAALPKLKK